MHMKIIFGLGNPGDKYAGTRHNVGFEIVEKIKETWNFPDFKFNKKFNAEISKGDVEGKEILLVKPQTFMNLSGQAVASALDFYKLTPDDIIVIHDDLDIAVGKYRIAVDSSSAGHNGVQNIIETLATQKFKRLRVGIGEETKEGAIVCRTGVHDYVLGKFSEEEAEKISKIEDNILGEIKN